MVRVTVWNEFRKEKTDESVKAVYPLGLHKVIAGFLDEDQEITVRTATLDEPEHGLTNEVLEATDVLIWWAHVAHREVEEAVAEKVKEQVLKGMGLIVLHSGHICKPFKKLMGTSCTLKWRDDDRERLWCCNPAHPIAKGVPEYIDIEHEEMYGEFFDIPQPDELVFIGWFAGGEVFRSGCTFHRGYGRIFYFQPGHEEYPVYMDPNIQKIICNAVHWAAPQMVVKELVCPNPKPLEPWKAD
ncbi:MAG TPA: trehalose utilization protein ThuA [Clostridiales bacterium]|nr:trehalose utilization protein ThuA [Clostridiales bacterium]